MSIHGRYFDARSAQTNPATLEATAEGQWRLAIGATELIVDPAQARISDRIGNIPRRIHLPDGTEFETTDNDGVDTLLVARGDRRGGVVHALERRWGIALAALAGVALVSFAVIRWGVPATAGWAASRVPVTVDQRIGSGVLEVLDHGVLQPTRLPPQQQSRVENLFLRMTAGLHDGHEYRLELRTGRLGPNAFALPSGIIVFTDELVKLAGSDEEIMAVMAHEIGHVRGRHALRQIIQAAGISALAVAVLGDLSTVSSLATAAPALLQAKNSRELEREADGFAREWLRDNRIDPRHFDAILCRMTDQGRRGGKELPGFLATHPAVDERARCDARSIAGSGASP